MRLSTKQVTEVNNVRFATYNRGGGFESLTSNLFVSSYISDSAGGATLKTVAVTNSGTIVAGHTHQLDGAAPNITLANGGSHAIERLADNRFVVAWPGENTKGGIQTFTISVSGITAVQDSLLIFSQNAKWISMAKDGSKTVLVYAGVDGDGYITLVKPPEVAPGHGVLSSHAVSDSTIRLSFIPGTSGTDTPKTFDVQCRNQGQSTWRAVVTDGPIPAGYTYTIRGLENGTTLECQWRLNSDHGKGEWSNTATVSYTHLTLPTICSV